MLVGRLPELLGDAYTRWVWGSGKKWVPPKCLRRPAWVQSAQPRRDTTDCHVAVHVWRIGYANRIARAGD